MTKQELGVLLARIDERTLNMWRVLDESDQSINKKVDQILLHQIKQNGSILRNTIWRRIIVGIGGSAVMALILHLIGVY